MNFLFSPGDAKRRHCGPLGWSYMLLWFSAHCQNIAYELLKHVLNVNIKETSIKFFTLIKYTFEILKFHLIL